MVKLHLEHGFNLVELMIVLVVLAILATLAIPGYQDVMQKGRRGDAMASLLRIQLEQEKWRGSHATYGTLADVWTGTDSLDGYYTMGVTGNNATGFTATAVPKAGQPQAGDSCGTFAIHQDGPDHTGTYADLRCWNR